LLDDARPRTDATTVEPTKRPFQGRRAKAFGRRISLQFEG
jgi:hypothetical protein